MFRTRSEKTLGRFECRNVEVGAPEQTLERPPHPGVVIYDRDTAAGNPWRDGLE
jgi:hypothetical protein